MQYRQRSVLFAAPWLIIGVAAVGASGGITIADFEKPELLIAALFVGIFIGMAVEQFLTAASRHAWRERNRQRSEERAATSASYRAPGFRRQLLSHRGQSMPRINCVS
jgi:F0F1-type ATP synthase membrane subunit c/vacuolar-type H+-ATPase subunit K